MKLKNFINKTRNFVKRSRGYKVFMHNSTKTRRGRGVRINRRPYRSLKQPSRLKKTANFLYKHKGVILSPIALALLAKTGRKVNIDDMLPVNQNDMQYGQPNWDDVFDPY
jgi:hypothetical protein